MASDPFQRPFPDRRFTSGLPLALALFSTTLLAGPVPFEIVPGPRGISAEEKSLTVDPSRGSDKAIILILESERDDRGRAASYLKVRLRAKIFSNEGRHLGDLEIPHPPGTMLQKFWAWTLLPDGSVEELPRQDLREEPVPELTAAARVHPVVFPFPRLERSVIEITAPPGYATAPPPSVAPIEAPYGHYALFISQTAAGYHVERVFSLTAEEVPVAGYEHLRRFLSRVRQADRTEVEFRKAE